MTATPPKHFLMLREFHLADVLTLANAACGLAAVFFAMHYMSSRSPIHFFAAAALSPAALLFDWFDGRGARRRHQCSDVNWIRWPTLFPSELPRRPSDLRPACGEGGTGSR